MRDANMYNEMLKAKNNNNNNPNQKDAHKKQLVTIFEFTQHRME